MSEPLECTTFLTDEDSMKGFCEQVLKGEQVPVWLDYEPKEQVPWWEEYYRWQAQAGKYGMFIRVRTVFGIFDPTVYFFPHQNVRKALDDLFSSLISTEKGPPEALKEPILERKQGEQFYTLAEDQTPKA